MQNPEGVTDLREAEMIKLGPCPRCGKKLLEGSHGALVPFYVVSISTALTDPNALRRRVGLEMQIGVLASFMGPDEPLAKVLPPTKFILHQDCALSMDGLMECVETISDRAKEAAE